MTYVISHAELEASLMTVMWMAMLIAVGAGWAGASLGALTPLWYRWVRRRVARRVRSRS